MVVDASTVVEWLLQTATAARIEARLFSRTTRVLHLLAPHLLDVEVASALRRLVAVRHVSAVRARQAIDDLSTLPVMRYPHDWCLPRVWELRHALTPYDAAYVALAETFECPLLTCDRRLAGAAGHRARVELV